MPRAFRALAAACLLAVPLAACTSGEEQLALNAASTACSAGLAPLITVVSSLGGVPIVLPAPVADLGCQIVLSEAQAAIEAITSKGGTAAVTVQTTDPKTRLKATRHATFAPGGKVVFRGSVAPDVF